MNIFITLLKQAAPRALLGSSLLVGLAGASSVAVIALSLYAAGELVQGRQYQFYLFLLPALTGVLLISRYVAQTWIGQATERILEQRLREATNRLRQAELFDIEQQNLPDILLTLRNTSDITLAAFKTLNIFQVIISLACCWLYIFYLSPEAAFIVIIAFLIAISAYKVFIILTQEGMQKEAELEAGLFRIFHQLLAGFKELKLHPLSYQSLFSAYLRPLNQENQRMRATTAFYFSEYHLFTDICSYIAMGCIGVLLITMGAPTTALTIFTLLILMGKLILVLLGQLPSLANGQAALEQLDRLIAQLSTDKPLVETLYQPKHEILRRFQTLKIQALRFAYPSTPERAGFAIGPASLTINAGEILFISGGNGSGKTTLLKSLTGLYPADAESVTLDGRPIRLCDYRYLFAGVFSEYHVFDRLYGVKHADDAQITAWLTEMDLFGRVQYRDGRFTTLKLSTGQRKRLALISALAEDRLIYVFDEWAADQAPAFRRYFYEQILPGLQARGKTVIAISHDERYFGAANRLVKMDYGQLIEVQ